LRGRCGAAVVGAGRVCCALLGRHRRARTGLLEAGNDDAEKEKLSKELMEAFKKVEEKKSASGPTYGELLKAHKLPE